METKCEIRLGDCAEILREYADGQFDLIVTSPPYADSRSNTYGGIKPREYVDWFLRRAKEFLRVLNPTDIHPSRN
jgi:DNA modification methylase